MRLFKYCNEKGVDLLIHKRMKFTPINQLNDPFEALPKIIIKNDSNADNLLYISNIRSDIAKGFGSLFGVVSLSNVSDSLLMWSHYTNGHKGFVIELDTDKLGVTQHGTPMQLFKVRYTTKVCSLEINPKMSELTSDSENEFINIVQTKSTEWAYEDEYRYLTKVKEYDKSTNGDYYHPINTEGIISVNLGYYCERLKEQIVNVLNHSDYKHVKLRSSYPDNNDYKLKFIDIKKDKNGRFIVS